MELSIVCNKPVKGGKSLYSVKYGSIDVVNVLAYNESDAEIKFLFTLAHELKGKTIDFNPEKL